MSHIAIVEQLNGNAFGWMEQVSDEQYQAVLRQRIKATKPFFR
jgi:hypothetical protein